MSRGCTIFLYKMHKEQDFLLHVVGLQPDLVHQLCLFEAAEQHHTMESHILNYFDEVIKKWWDDEYDKPLELQLEMLGFSTEKAKTISKKVMQLPSEVLEYDYPIRFAWNYIEDMFKEQQQQQEQQLLVSRNNSSSSM